MSQPTATTRVAVLFDWQNVYMCAKEAFGLDRRDYIAGQVDPWRLGRLLASGASIDAHTPASPDRGLHSVAIYRGRPDRDRDPKAFAAFRSQVAAWENAGKGYLTVKHRDLRYPPPGDTQGKIREKGVDVALAVDLVAMAFRQTVDRVVVMSGDTDLIPAIELAVSERGPDFVETAGWKGPHRSPALLQISGNQLRKRPLGERAFALVRDETDYTLSKRERDRRQQQSAP